MSGAKTSKMNAWFHAAGSSAELISIERFLDDHIFATRSGAYGASFRCFGIDPECPSDEELASISARLVQALRLLPEDCTVYQIAIKRRDCQFEPSQHPESDTEMRRRAHLSTRKLGTVELYWTLCIHPPKLHKRAKPKAQCAQSGGHAAASQIRDKRDAAQPRGPRLSAAT
jgi:type IV secretion system protein VirB4